MFGIVIKASAWSVDNPAHIEEYIIYAASKEKIPVGEALAIAQCESSLNRFAKNQSSKEKSLGIFQINLLYHPLTEKEAYNPFININYAMDLYLKEGWTPWFSCGKKHGIIT